MTECRQAYFNLNGEFLDCGSFQIDLINKGRSIYEVARISGPRILFLEDHLDRLRASLRMEGIEPWLSRVEIRTSLKELISKNKAKEGNVKIIFNVRDDGGRNFLIYFVNHYYPSQDDYFRGVKVITYPFERLEPNKKLWRPAFRAGVAEAIRNGNAFEALLLDSQGTLPEASKANLFAIKDGKVITPPDELILPGITRKYVLSLCRETGIPVQMRKIYLYDLQGMDAVFLTGTSLHVLPVARIDDHKIPVNNPVMNNILKQFNAIIQTHYI
jgi:branched-chain amino acid aminotransferase